MKKLAVIGTILLLLLGFSGQSMGGVHIGVNIPLPPVFVFPASPELVVIPGTYVYYCPDVNFDISFYDGYWYRPYEGYWYRSVNYGGPWGYIASPPTVVLSLPSDFRIATRGFRHIPYGELHRNWRAWKRDRYWEYHNWGRPEHKRHYGVAPSFREREHGGHGGEIHRGGEFHGGGRHEEHERH